MKKLDTGTVLEIINMLEEEILAYDRMLELAESKSWEARRSALLVFQHQLAKLCVVKNQTEQ